MSRTKSTPRICRLNAFRLRKRSRFRTAQGIVSQAVIIENDGLMEEAEFTPPTVETHDDLIKAVRASGAVGLGGAGFPTHVKLNFPQDGSVDTLIINAAECEPYITVDYRECLDNSWDVI